MHSPAAQSLRVGFDVRGVDGRLTLRFGGAAGDGQPVAAITVEDASRLPGDDGLFWSPSTDGEVQWVELHRPAGVPAGPVRLYAPRLSHDLIDSRGGGPLAKIGESGACNVDVVCRAAELGPRFVEAENAVAQMRFVRGGTTRICTGTLLVDVIPETQVPYLHSANACFSDNTSLPPNASQMQAVANTLNTLWNYETTGCGNLVQTPITQVSGGAAFLTANQLTGGMLLRLNNAAPSIAFFAGWSIQPLAAGTAVTTLHHPSGDAKKVSLGQLTGQDEFGHVAGWTSGTTEGGSIGAGLFTVEAGGDYRLRGALDRGLASCANSGNLGNLQNRDVFSRLDVDMLQMGRWLATPEVVFGNGFEP